LNLFGGGRVYLFCEAATYFLFTKIRKTKMQIKQLDFSLNIA